jgi:hypothetical protein
MCENPEVILPLLWYRGKSKLMSGAARIFGPNRDEVTGDWRRLHNEELHNLYSSPSIIRIIKSRRMRWAGLGM